MFHKQLSWKGAVLLQVEIALSKRKNGIVEKVSHFGSHSLGEYEKLS